MTNETEAKTENCRLAMKAALEAIQDYCGSGESAEEKPTVRFQTHAVPIEYIPEDIIRILAESSSSMSAIEKLCEHEWIIGQAWESVYKALSDNAPKDLRANYHKYALKNIAETLYWKHSNDCL